MGFLPTFSRERIDSGEVAGHDTFHLVGPKACWYLELSGSGNETVSHLKENGRITILFMAFTGPPRIVRLFGKGALSLPPPCALGFALTRKRRQGLRARCAGIQRSRATRRSSSTPRRAIHHLGRRAQGRYLLWLFRPSLRLQRRSVRSPLLPPTVQRAYNLRRPTLLNFFTKRIEDDASSDPARIATGLKAYWVKKNAESLDGLPGLDLGMKGRPATKRRWRLEGFWGGVGVGVGVALLAWVVSSREWEGRELLGLMGLEEFF